MLSLILGDWQLMLNLGFLNWPPSIKYLSRGGKFWTQVISQGGQLRILVHRKFFGVARRTRHPVQDTGLQDSKGTQYNRLYTVPGNVLETVYTVQYLLPIFKRRRKKHSTAHYLDTIFWQIQIRASRKYRQTVTDRVHRPLRKDDKTQV